MTDIHTIALDLIEMEALPRDRSQTDPDADHELYTSIMLDGLRQPIEVWHRPSTDTYGLIAGHRRLAAFHKLAKDNERFQTVPAFIRTPESIPAAMAAMIAENEIRANISPWDRARIVVDACEEQIFTTPDEAISALHPWADDRKKRRLRALVTVVETYFHQFTDPHALSERKLLRLGATIRAGLEELVTEAIKRHQPKDTDAAWQLIAPILDEAEQVLAGAPRLKLPAKPRRMVHLDNGIHIRREYRPDGWALILTGNNADGVMAQKALDEVISWMQDE